MPLVGEWQLLPALVISVLLAAPLQAQGPTIATLRQGVSRLAPVDTAARVSVRSGGTGSRAVASLVGSTLGIVGGVWLAVKLLPQSECVDDPALCGAIPGAALGSIVGAGLGAALPRGNGACAFRRRVARGQLGAAIGFALGYGLLVIASDGDVGSAVVVGGLLGAAIGGTEGASRCTTQSGSTPPS